LQYVFTEFASYPHSGCRNSKGSFSSIIIIGTLAIKVGSN